MTYTYKCNICGNEYQSWPVDSFFPRESSDRVKVVFRTVDDDMIHVFNHHCCPECIDDIYRYIEEKKESYHG